MIFAYEARVTGSDHNSSIFDFTERVKEIR